LHHFFMRTRRLNPLNLPIITLLSDFGLQDGYVASMKGVILEICPNARLVDISHLIAPQDVRSGAFVLYASYQYFPRGTVHLAVVDPGVGTERRAVAIRTGSSFFVGPDNGLFSLILKKETKWETRKLENPKLRRSSVSSTFHGRDLFAPAAAHLACGVGFHTLGPLVLDPISPQWREPIIAKGEVIGEVIHIDRFGNATTNVRSEILEKRGPADQWRITTGKSEIRSIRQTYGRVRTGEALALTGSTGFIEIAVNQGNAACELELDLGTKVSFRLEDF
jgi:hypothetical protein